MKVRKARFVIIMAMMALSGISVAANIFLHNKATRGTLDLWMLFAAIVVAGVLVANEARKE